MTRVDYDELTETWRDAIEACADRVVPLVLPPDWRCFERLANGAWFRSRDGIRALLAVENVDDELWIHVSFSRKDRVPSWFDTKRVKEVLIGAQRKAVVVLPREAEYFDCHKYCLHLFACFDRDPLPDFRDARGGL